MAQELGIPSNEEVRGPIGRHDYLGDFEPVTGLAGILKSDNSQLKDLFGDSYTRIPWESLKREGNYKFPKDASFSFMGKDITPKMERIWKTGVLHGLNFSKRLERAIGTYDWVIENQPKGVVVWTDEYPECRAALMAARDLKIPTFEVIHGGFHPYMIGHLAAQKSFADWKFGSYEYKDWHSFYELSGEVIATGITTLDVWADPNLPALRENARYQLKVPPSVPVICYLDDAPFGRNPWGDSGIARNTFIQFLRAFYVLKDLIGNLTLIYKKHPYSSEVTLQGIEELIRKANISENYTLIDDNLPLALLPSDITVGPMSTAMIAGLTMGLPALPLNFTPFFEEHLYQGYGFECIREPESIVSKILHLVTDSDRMLALIEETQKGARRFSGAQDGFAAFRVRKAIGQIMNGKEPSNDCWSELP